MFFELPVKVGSDSGLAVDFIFRPIQSAIPSESLHPGCSSYELVPVADSVELPVDALSSLVDGVDSSQSDCYSTFPL